MGYIFAVLKAPNPNERQTSYVFSDFDALNRTLFPPDVDVLEMYELSVKGKTYQERKSYLEELAKNIQNADEGGLSWGEYSLLMDFFERNGKRFGLLREFRENGIC